MIRIVNGGKDMPAFGSMLNAQDLNAVTAFLQSRRQLDMGKVPDEQ